MNDIFKNTNNTLNRGGVGLARAIYEYQKLGYTVCLPLVDAQEYDLVIIKDKLFQTVQCRVTSVNPKDKNNNKILSRFVVSLRTIKTNTKQTIVKSKGSFDLLFALCSNGDCYSIPHSKLPNSAIIVGCSKYQEFQIGNK